MARLFLVRHGENEQGGSGRYWGHTDVPLSPAGFKQAEALRDRLGKEEIHGIYSSDLQRALSTAEVVASAHSVEVVPCSALREINFGEWEGMTFEEIEKRFPKAACHWTGREVERGFPGGERLRDLTRRTGDFLGQLRKHPPEQTVLVVAHSGPLRVMLCRLLRVSPKRYWQIRLDLASLTILETYLEGAILSLLNDTCHLHLVWRKTWASSAY